MYRNDYFSFGLVSNRNYSLSGGYRYAFHLQEKDDEVKCKGNSLNFKFGIHDPRIERFIAVDPLAEKYPGWSPYNYTLNNPIKLVNTDGRATPLIEATITYFIHNAKDYDAYWYHSDHLGSSSYIINLNGEISKNKRFLRNSHKSTSNFENTLIIDGGPSSTKVNKSKSV